MICMEPVSNVSLPECYMSTVNESETITAAKPYCPFGSQTGAPCAQSPDSGSRPGFMAAAQAERSAATVYAERSAATVYAERSSATIHAELSSATAHAELSSATAHAEPGSATAHVERS